METADLTSVVEALIKQHNYNPDESVGATALSYCDLIDEVRKIDAGLLDKRISVIPTYENDAEEQEGEENLALGMVEPPFVFEYIEVRYEVAEGIIIVNPEQIDPMDYDTPSFPESVALFLKDVTDRAAVIAERFNEQFVLKADYV